MLGDRIGQNHFEDLKIPQPFKPLVLSNCGFVLCSEFYELSLFDSGNL